MNKTCNCYKVWTLVVIFIKIFNQRRVIIQMIILVDLKKLQIGTTLFKFFFIEFHVDSILGRDDGNQLYDDIKGFHSYGCSDHQNQQGQFINKRGRPKRVVSLINKEIAGTITIMSIPIPFMQRKKNSGHA